MKNVFCDGELCCKNKKCKKCKKCLHFLHQKMRKNILLLRMVLGRVLCNTLFDTVAKIVNIKSTLESTLLTLKKNIFTLFCNLLRN